MSADGLSRLRESIDALSELSRAVAARENANDDRGLADYLPADLPSLRTLVVASDEVSEALGRAVDGARETVIWTRPWQELGEALEGGFDIVCCEGVLYRVLEPLSLLATLRAMLAPRGLLVIESLLLADPERSEYLRLLPSGHAEKLSWRLIPGRLALRWMVQAAGFEPDAEFGEREGPRDGLPLISLFLSAHRTPD